MNEITNEAILNLISVLLVIGAFAVCVLFYFAYDMEQDMKRIQEGERDTDPQPYTPDPEHIKRILDEWELRKPLPVYRSTHGAAQAYDHALNAQDIARGTSDNLLIAAARSVHE